MTGSKDVFLTLTVKVTSPPGSSTTDGSAVLSTSMVGLMSVRVTVASSVSVAVLPSLSTAAADTMSVWLAPALPAKAPVNEHE